MLHSEIRKSAFLCLHSTFIHISFSLLDISWSCPLLLSVSASPALDKPPSFLTGLVLLLANLPYGFYPHPQIAHFFSACQEFFKDLKMSPRLKCRQALPIPGVWLHSPPRLCPLSPLLPAAETSPASSLVPNSVLSQDLPVCCWDAFPYLTPNSHFS